MTVEMSGSSLDEVLKQLGGWRRFQILYYTSLSLVIIFSVFPAMSYIFTSRDVKYRCRIDQCELENGDFSPNWLENAVPFIQETPSRCFSHQALKNSTCEDFDSYNIQVCDRFIYEQNQTTIVQDFNITCDENLWKLTIVGSVNVMGKLISLPILGLISDRYGRKFVVVTNLLFSTLIGLLRSFSVNYIMFVVLEFLDRALSAGLYSGAFILAMEMVDVDRRNMGNTVISCAFTIGHILLGVVAWGAPTWQSMLQISYVPGFLILILFHFTPESVRWLLSKNRTEEAVEILQSMAKINGLELSDAMVKKLPHIQIVEEEQKCVRVLNRKTLILRTMHCSFTWMCCNFPYFGLTIASVALSKNVFLNFIYTAIVEMPAYVFGYFYIDKWGRRNTLAISLISTGVFSICVLLPEKGTWAALIVFLLGKFFITISYATLYIYTAELFPTSSRHSAFAICAMFGCFGAMLAPQVPLLARIHEPLPLFIVSAMTLTAGILAFLFPETYCKDKGVNVEVDQQDRY